MTKLTEGKQNSKLCINYKNNSFSFHAQIEFTVHQNPGEQKYFK